MPLPAAAAHAPERARCWCGGEDLSPFSPDYRRCAQCGTLVAAPPAVPAPPEAPSRLYGLDYFVDHARSMGHPTLEERARLDLPERCAFWLETLLRFRPPPARTLELGCANGAFVGLLAEAGYDAVGLDLDPEVTRLARDAFQVPVLTGPIEAQDLPAASLDVAIMMDVLEHLPDPPATLAAIGRLLAPDGVLLVQTPRFEPARSYEDLAATRDPFLAQLKPAEHLFLFSPAAAAALLTEAGFAHVRFAPAIFAHYDMSFVASRAPLAERTPDAGRAALRRTRAGRIVEALLDAGASLREASARSAALEREAAEHRDARHAREDEARALRAVAAELAARRTAAEAAHQDLIRRLGPLARLFPPRP
jgi:SAM-dependent methyltransferase